MSADRHSIMAFQRRTIPYSAVLTMEQKFYSRVNYPEEEGRSIASLYIHYSFYCVLQARL